MIMKMSENGKRAKRCCFTGHRPEKLKLPEEIIYTRLSQAIEYAIDQGKTTFICGMARGIDLWAGQVVIGKKMTHPELKLICAAPFVGFEQRWSMNWQQLYAFVLAHADYKVAASKRYAPDCFQRRNEWMVNHSSLVIAAYNGERGGTRNTIQFAKACGIPIHNIFDFSLDV